MLLLIVFVGYRLAQALFDAEVYSRRHPLRTILAFL